MTAHDFDDTVDCAQQVVFRDTRTSRAGARVEFVTSEDLPTLPFAWDYLFVEDRAPNSCVRWFLALLCAIAAALLLLRACSY